MPVELSEMVRGWVQDGHYGLNLRGEVSRQVACLARPYPDAYFELNQKTPEAIEGLADRVFTVCSRVAKGRFPFSGREPFRAVVEEEFDSRDIRYHCFYARLSVARELLRDDYARNVSRDPALRWRAELFAEVGRALAKVAVPEGGRASRTAVWRLDGAGPSLVRRQDQVLEGLRRLGTTDVSRLVEAALRLGGPSTQSRVSNLLAEVLDPPAAGQDLDDAHGVDPAQELAVRQAVAEGWAALAPEDQALLAAIARGDSYDELIAQDPRFRNRVAVTRAVERLNRVFLGRLALAFGVEALPDAPPKELLDLILDVLRQICAATDGAAYGGVL